MGEMTPLAQGRSLEGLVIISPYLHREIRYHQALNGSNHKEQSELIERHPFWLKEKRIMLTKKERSDLSILLGMRLGSKNSYFRSASQSNKTP
jgi:hypothetical protein